MASSSLVIRVRHADEGEVTVRVDDSPAAGALIFAGELAVPSGVLRVADALGNVTAEVGVEPGPLQLEIYADSNVEASDLRIVVE